MANKIPNPFSGIAVAIKAAADKGGGRNRRSTSGEKAYRRHRGRQRGDRRRPG